VSRRRRLVSLYARIGRTFYTRAGSLLLLAAVVFVPLGLLDALAVEVSVDALNVGDGIKVAAGAAAAAALTLTSLLGEVFYSGAVAVSLTHPEHEHAPPIREVARRLDYRRLIVVDILYFAVVAAGTILFFVPGILVFVWFGLAGPVVEIEKQTVRGAFSRSFHLVRHNFWLVLLVLGPIEIIGDSGGRAIVGLVHDLLGHSLIATWFAESASNIILTPIFAVAAVLLTLELIAEKDGSGGVPGSPAPLATPRR
jgi:hypothetical protein